MPRSVQITAFILIGMIGVVVAGWAGYACVTMKPETYTLMRESDDGTRIVCTTHTSIGSYFRRGMLGLGVLAGSVTTLVAVSSLAELRKR